MKNKNISRFIPNTVTVMNIAMGLLVIFSFASKNSSEHNRKIACILIFIAVILDFMDGRLARKLNAVSEIGKQLDSFADIISFGIAPMMILFSSVNFDKHFMIIVYLVSFFYVVCGVMRLARYNVGNFKEFFLGIPITIAGLIITLYFWVSLMTGFSSYMIFNWIGLLLALVLGILMVSSFKVYRPKFTLKSQDK